MPTLEVGFGCDAAELFKRSKMTPGEDEIKIPLSSTKSALIISAKSQETADKSNALQKWIKEKQSKCNFEIIGGIVIEKYPN